VLVFMFWYRNVSSEAARGTGSVVAQEKKLLD